MNLIKHQLHL